MKNSIKQIFPILTLLLVMTLWGHTVQAQNLSNKGRFEVDFVRGCAPLTVNVTELDTLGAGVNRQYDYETDSSFVTGTTHTYTDPGNYQIVQLINVDTLTDKLDTIQITVLDSPDPVFELFNCKNNTVSIDISGETYYDSMEIDYGDGTILRVVTGSAVADYTYAGLAPQSFTVSVRGLLNNASPNCPQIGVPITTIGNLITADLFSTLVTQTSDTGSIEITFNLGPNVNYDLLVGANGTALSTFTQLNNVGTFTFNNFDTESNYFCFQLQAFDICDGQTLDSETVCTLLLTTTAEDDQNRLDWVTMAPAGSRFDIFRDGQLIHSAVDISTYTDTDVTCLINYCYEIEVVYPSGAFANSNESCVTAISTANPPAIPDITATVNGQDIEVSWDAPPAPTIVSNYVIQKSSNESFFATVDTTTTTGYVDVGVRTASSTYCYRIDYFDECGNASIEGMRACAMLLTADDEDVAIVSEFNWTEYEGWINGINEYVVEKLDQNGGLISATPVGMQTSFTDNNIDPTAQFVAYRIRAIGNDGFEAVSNVLTFEYNAELFIPKAFTPNNDGVNDSLEINSIFVDQFSIQFYNRWGEQIYSSEDISQSWDGLLGKNEAPQGTYWYVAEISDFQGKTIKQSGSFLLLR